ncbi:hypothetical protein SOASR030_22510 [Leminorella grimontii]|uniref:Uncharacterized protein n=1 Tax=Leminorella grimontii TaxID=82981 RepID=A0AAV5N341_9GAMM|nr:hypothetical protein [Leminorella grimontii]KFC96632.1 hypothetical protein GLGR_0994 [Leminorella grimontii ATCC 33999 = DSM 5078]GKX56139.1 hypothetical protein SOASR030_22510 [Leminorella grimontii]VFS57954.1 Uncharacterised protein [Leminorella grimontii]
MATTPTQIHPLLNIPFSPNTDFTRLADYCEQFTEALIESDDPALRLALCGRLISSLSLLRATINDPIPEHLVERFIVDEPPVNPPRFEPDSEQLCGYCLALAQLLTGRALPLGAEQPLSDLLFGLVGYFAAELKSPRWLRVRTADGLLFTSEGL